MSNRSPVSQWGFVICEFRLFLANGVYNNLRSLFLSVVEFVLSMSVFLLVRMCSISMCSNANFKLSENTQTRPAEFLFQFVCRFWTHESGWQDNSTISCPKCAHLWCWGFTWCDELTGNKNYRLGRQVVHPWSNDRATVEPTNSTNFWKLFCVTI